ncbi:MAG: hypothetical protein V1835_00370 [Candidatus Micrarchaeota archaeon]
MFFDEEFEEDEAKKLNMTLAKTILLHVVFILPIAYLFFFSANRVFSVNPYAWISVILHEFGHFLFRQLGGGSLYPHVLGGTLTEYLAPVIMIILCLRSRSYSALALIFIACIGTNLPYTANYMESASHPFGYSYLSGAPLTVSNHDWFYLLSRWGVLGQESTIGAQLRLVGEVLMLLGIMGSTIGLVILLKHKPASFWELLLLGGGISGLFFLVTMQFPQLILALMILVVPASIVGFTALMQKRKAK